MIPRRGGGFIYKEDDVLLHCQWNLLAYDDKHWYELGCANENEHRDHSKGEIMNRIYQGRVSKVEILNGKNADGQPLDNWQDILWRHHELFQDAVNF